MIKKTCTKCKIPKPLEEFYRDKTKAHERSGICKECYRAYRAVNKLKRKENFVKWREENPEYWKLRYINNRDTIRNQQKIYAKINPDIANARSHRRRAKQRAGGSYTEREWQTLLLITGGLCVCCSSISKLEVDHIVPLARGGSNSIENIQPLCRTCNASKGAQTINYLGRVQA